MLCGLGTVGLEVQKTLDFSPLWGPLSPLGSIGWDWTTTKNLKAVSCPFWAVTVVSYRANSVRGANGSQVEFLHCW